MYQRITPPLNPQLQGKGLLQGAAIVSTVAFFLPVISVLGISFSFYEFLTGVGILMYIGSVAALYYSPFAMNTMVTVKRYSLTSAIFLSLIALIVWSDSDGIFIRVSTGGYLLSIGVLLNWIAVFYAKNLSLEQLQNQMQMQMAAPYGQMGYVQQPMYQQGYSQPPPMQQQPFSQPVSPAVQQYPVQQDVTNQSKLCNQCGETNKLDVEFCRNCGAPMSAPIEYQEYCPDCGVGNDLSSKFCKSCGSQMDISKDHSSDPANDNQF